MKKKLLLHFNFIKKALEDEPITVKALADLMEEEFQVNFSYVYGEVQELISINKIKVAKYNNEKLLCWSQREVQFEHELSTNMIHLDKQFKTFICVPSSVRQMRLPLYIIGALGEELKNLGNKFELMLELKAIKSNKVWYNIEKR